MANAKGVKFTFASLGEARNTSILTVGVELIATPSQNFVTVRLMSDVPN